MEQSEYISPELLHALLPSLLDTIGMVPSVTVQDVLLNGLEDSMATLQEEPAPDDPEPEVKDSEQDMSDLAQRLGLQLNLPGISHQRTEDRRPKSPTSG